MSHPPSKFTKYADTPLQHYILPIMPAGATLRSTSTIKVEQLGKIPGIWYPDGWTGVAWQNCRVTATILKRWQEWQEKTGTAIAIALNTADVHGGDIDSDKQGVVDAVRAIFAMFLGITPVVRRPDGSTRCVLFYKHKNHTAPIDKFRIAFIDKEGDKHIVEFLARGQQVVIEGPHAKGAMHQWETLGLIEGYAQLPEVTLEMVNACFRALNKWVEDEGFTLEKLALPPGGSHGEGAVSITDLMSPHLVRGGDTGMLAQAIAAIDINDPKLAGYDTWCAMFRAMWAACGGDRQFYDDHIWPWLRGNPANKEKDMEQKLASFHDSQIGADFVFGWAASFGFTEGISASQGVKAQEIFKDAPTTVDEGQDPQDSGLARGGPAATAAGGGGQSGGPFAFPYTDMALADLFAAQHPDFRYTPDQGWVKLESGVYMPTKTVLRLIADVCAAVGAPYRAMGGSRR
jgi:hypothetical protein